MATKENEKILSLDRYLELKEQGFEFEGQSYLFWEYMRILTELRKHNPDIKFLLENVKMKKEWERVLTEAIGVPGVHINSALVSAQNRKRIYWTNIDSIEQPEDRGLLLRDVLQSEVDEKYFLKEEVVKNMIAHRDRCKAKGYGFGAIFHKGEQKMAALKIGGRGVDDLVEVNKHLAKNLTSTDEKAQCFLATSWKGAWVNGMTLIEQEPRIRRLTPTECARLQTIPEWYKWQCSETQQYKMLGNGWTVEVIKHIFSHL